MTEEGIVPPAWGLSPSLDVSLLPASLAEALTAFVAATDALTGADPGELDGPQAALVAAVLATGTSRLVVAKARLLPVIEADGLWAVDGARSFPVWVAATHRASIATARAQVRLGRALRDHLPATADAAAAGVISAEHAQVLATHTTTSPQRLEVLADPGQECNEDFLVAQARQLHVDALRALARHWAAAADPDADDRGYTESTDREHLDLARLAEGYHLTGWLTVDHGQALKQALEAVTPVPAADDDRTPSQRRAQALADLARLGLDHGLVGTGRAVRPRISVLVSHADLTALASTARIGSVPTQGTLLGDAVEIASGSRSSSEGRVEPEAAGAGIGTTRHGEVADPQIARHTPDRTPALVNAAMLTGQAAAGGPQFEDGTPIPRTLLDRLACDSELHRILFGPHSEVLDVGRTERTFTRARRTAIIARDKHCQYPTCTAPPALCEGHHVDHWSRDHGPTAVDNGILLCWHHHALTHQRHLEIHRRDSRWVFLDRHGLPIDPDRDREPAA